MAEILEMFRRFFKKKPDQPPPTQDPKTPVKANLELLDKPLYLSKGTSLFDNGRHFPSTPPEPEGPRPLPPTPPSPPDFNPRDYIRPSLIEMEEGDPDSSLQYSSSSSSSHSDWFKPIYSSSSDSNDSGRGQERNTLRGTTRTLKPDIDASDFYLASDQLRKLVGHELDGIQFFDPLVVPRNKRKYLLIGKNTVVGTFESVLLDYFDVKAQELSPTLKAIRHPFAFVLPKDKARPTPEFPTQEEFRIWVWICANGHIRGQEDDDWGTGNWKEEHHWWQELYDPWPKVKAQLEILKPIFTKTELGEIVETSIETEARFINKEDPRNPLTRDHLTSLISKPMWDVNGFPLKLAKPRQNPRKEEWKKEQKEARAKIFGHNFVPHGYMLNLLSLRTRYTFFQNSDYFPSKLEIIEGRKLFAKKNDTGTIQNRWTPDRLQDPEEDFEIIKNFVPVKKHYEERGNYEEQSSRVDWYETPQHDFKVAQKDFVYAHDYLPQGTVFPMDIPGSVAGRPASESTSSEENLTHSRFKFIDPEFVSGSQQPSHYYWKFSSVDTGESKPIPVEWLALNKNPNFKGLTTATQDATQYDHYTRTPSSSSSEEFHPDRPDHPPSPPVDILDLFTPEHPPTTENLLLIQSINEMLKKKPIKRYIKGQPDPADAPDIDRTGPPPKPPRAKWTPLPKGYIPTELPTADIIDNGEFKVPYRPSYDISPEEISNHILPNLIAIASKTEPNELPTAGLFDTTATELPRRASDEMYPDGMSSHRPHNPFAIGSQTGEINFKTGIRNSDSMSLSSGSRSSKSGSFSSNSNSESSNSGSSSYSGSKSSNSGSELSGLGSSGSKGAEGLGGSNLSWDSTCSCTCTGSCSCSCSLAPSYGSVEESQIPGPPPTFENNMAEDNWDSDEDWEQEVKVGEGTRLEKNVGHVTNQELTDNEMRELGFGALLDLEKLLQLKVEEERDFSRGYGAKPCQPNNGQEQEVSFYGVSGGNQYQPNNGSGQQQGDNCDRGPDQPNNGQQHGGNFYGASRENPYEPNNAQQQRACFNGGSGAIPYQPNNGQEQEVSFYGASGGNQYQPNNGSGQQQGGNFDGGPYQPNNGQQQEVNFYGASGGNHYQPNNGQEQRACFNGGSGAKPYQPNNGQEQEVSFYGASGGNYYQPNNGSGQQQGGNFDGGPYQPNNGQQQEVNFYGASGGNHYQPNNGQEQRACFNGGSGAKPYQPSNGQQQEVSFYGASGGNHYQPNNGSGQQQGGNFDGGPYRPNNGQQQEVNFYGGSGGNHYQPNNGNGQQQGGSFDGGPDVIPDQSNNGQQQVNFFGGYGVNPSLPNKGQEQGGNCYGGPGRTPYQPNNGQEQGVNFKRGAGGNPYQPKNGEAEGGDFYGGLGGTAFDPNNVPPFYATASTREFFSWHKDLMGTPTPPAPSPPPRDLAKKKKEDEKKKKKKSSKPSRSKRSLEDMAKMREGGNCYGLKYTKDFVYENARDAILLPPRRPRPVYIDDNKGSRHLYCPSGLANCYVYKKDYGKIPAYLQERNQEQGRPPIPDFSRFYRPQVCKYIFGHYHCPICDRPHPYNSRGKATFDCRKYDPLGRN